MSARRNRCPRCECHVGYGTRVAASIGLGICSRCGCKVMWGTGNSVISIIEAAVLSPLLVFLPFIDPLSLMGFPTVGSMILEATGSLLAAIFFSALIWLTPYMLLKATWHRLRPRPCEKL